MLILILKKAIFSFEKALNGQNHSSSGSQHLVKKSLPTPKKFPPTLLSTIWKTLIYKVVIFGSLVPEMCKRASCAQVHELPQRHCGDKQDGALFS